MTNEHKDLPALPRAAMLIGPDLESLSLRYTADQMRAIQAEAYDIGYSAALAARPEPAGVGLNMDELVNLMWRRFLGWPLPKTFAPDCGVSFDGRKDDMWNKNKTWPTGTNLFNAAEAHAMFEYCLTDLPQAAPQARPVSDASESACKMCGDIPRIAAQRLMLKDRFANREPSPATADFDLPPACIEEPPTAPDAGARDAALEEAARCLIERAGQHYSAGHITEQDECLRAADSIRDLKTAPAKPAQDLVAAIEATPLDVVVRVLASLGIDSEKSKFGFDELQVRTTVSCLRTAAAALVAAHLKGGK